MSSSSNTATHTKKIIRKMKFAKKARTPSPTPSPQLSAVEVSDSDMEDNAVSEPPSPSPLASEPPSPPSPVVSEPSGDEVVCSGNAPDDKAIFWGKHVEALKPTEEAFSVALRVARGKITGGDVVVSHEQLSYNENCIARAIEQDYFAQLTAEQKVAFKKSRSERSAFNLNTIRINSDAYKTIKTDYPQDDDEFYLNDAFKAVINEWVYKNITFMNNARYGCSPNSDDFLGGFLDTDEGKSRLDYYQDLYEDKNAKKKKRGKAKVATTEEVLANADEEALLKALEALRSKKSSL